MEESEAKVSSLHLWSSCLRMRTKILYVTNFFSQDCLVFILSLIVLLEENPLNILTETMLIGREILPGSAKLES